MTIEIGDKVKILSSETTNDCYFVYIGSEGTVINKAYSVVSEKAFYLIDMHDGALLVLENFEIEKV